MKAYSLTDIGRMRKVNQDSLFCSTEPVGPLPNLLFVADGMGGHKAGDFASRYLTEHLPEEIRKYTEGEPNTILSRAVEAVNRDIYRLSRENPELEGMGTTFVAAVVRDNVLCAANIGDSRLYRITPDGMFQVTRDHSYVEEMVSRGLMVRGSEEYMKRRNIITRAVGIGDSVNADFFEVELSPGDLLLLCSDGLSNMVDHSTLYRLALLPDTLEHRAAAMIAAANQNGGRDNISVVLADPQISEVNAL